MAAALHFARQKNVELVIYDFYYTKAMDKNIAKLKKFKNVRFVLGKRKLDEVKAADLIVKHQRIRRDEPEVLAARKAGKLIESELSLFIGVCPCPVVGITGTRGKSTTTAMTHAILEASGKWRKVWLGGNILVSPLTYLSKIAKNDIVVLEMSSFQLEGTGEAGLSPQIAVWTNLMRDHLNTYPSMAEYAEAKAQIFRHQKPEDVIFLPADKSFDVYAKEAPGRVIRVRVAAKIPLQIAGEHNQRNAWFALSVGRELGLPMTKIKQALKSFKGLPDRLETLGTRGGVSFINDTTATTPDGTIAALKTFPTKAAGLHLIFGGSDKVLEFAEVSDVLAKRKDIFVYLLDGTARAKIEPLFKQKEIHYVLCKDLKVVFRELKKWVDKGDTVLLSPGCTSFGLFKNEFDRGEQFRKLVKTWK